MLYNNLHKRAKKKDIYIHIPLLLCREGVSIYTYMQKAYKHFLKVWWPNFPRFTSQKKKKINKGLHRHSHTTCTYAVLLLSSRFAYDKASSPSSCALKYKNPPTPPRKGYVKASPPIDALQKGNEKNPQLPSLPSPKTCVHMRYICKELKGFASQSTRICILYAKRRSINESVRKPLHTHTHTLGFGEWGGGGYTIAYPNALWWICYV